MKTVWQERYGGAETWQVREVPVPVPQRGEVLVRVHAAGLDRGTWHLMTGRPLMMRPVTGLRGPRTHVPGRDLAGVVEAVGEGVTAFAVGDEVYGTTVRGSFAELVRAKVDRLAHKPADLTFEEAAAVPVSAQTALQALRDHGKVRAGQSVLVIGASGGVGSYAVQLAKAFGAEVTAVASSTKLDLVRSLGADHVVDYTREDLARHEGRYDLVLDIAGNRPVSVLRRLLTDRGTLVFVGGEDGGRWIGGMQRQIGAALRSPFVRHRLVMFVAKENAADLEELRGLLGDAGPRPAVDRAFPLAEAAKAMAHLESGHARGKVVLTV
jgi:NADPH:quinone reductase-like Zn-dependent oxidoreductase